MVISNIAKESQDFERGTKTNSIVETLITDEELFKQVARTLVVSASSITPTKDSAPSETEQPSTGMQEYTSDMVDADSVPGSPDAVAGTINSSLDRNCDPQVISPGITPDNDEATNVVYSCQFTSKGDSMLIFCRRDAISEHDASVSAAHLNRHYSKDSKAMGIPRGAAQIRPQFTLFKPRKFVKHYRGSIFSDAMLRFLAFGLPVLTLLYAALHYCFR